jgi:carbon-monoxide dehydrogenase medium subunit
MIPAEFGYVRASTLDEAIRHLSGSGGTAKVIAGGQSILPLMKLRLAQPAQLIDISRLSELRGVRELPDGRIGIGALTTYAELMESPAMNLGVLQDAVPTIGDVQVRNLGTVGGSVAHADPASDMPACLLALDAELVARSGGGERTIPIDGFFQGAFVTTLAGDELLTEIRVPAPDPGLGSAYRWMEHPASGYSIVGVAAVVGRDEGGRIASARIGITGVGDVAYRAKAVEGALVGSDGGASDLEAAAAHATEGVNVVGDIHADREYRTAMAAVYTRRAIEAALARVGG